MIYTRARRVFLLSALLAASHAASVASQSPEYEKSVSGTRLLKGAGGLVIKMLVEESNLGSSEIEVGEITFPVGAVGGDHLHESIEVFYVLSGIMGHVVNGKSHRLEPGMVGIVRPGDRVAHKVLSDTPVRAVVIWAPGGEASRLARFFEVEPLE